MLHPYWIKKLNRCEIGISPCPTGDLGLEAEIESLVQGDQIVIISLLTEEEKIALGLQDEKSICDNHGVEFMEFPITDMSIPGFIKYTEFIEELYPRTIEVDRILIHCRAGIGRSATIALGLMIKHGLSLKESIKLMSMIRGVDVPQSRSQRKLLSYFSNTIKEVN